MSTINGMIFFSSYVCLSSCKNYSPEDIELLGADELSILEFFKSICKRNFLKTRNFVFAFILIISNILVLILIQKTKKKQTADNESNIFSNHVPYQVVWYLIITCFFFVSLGFNRVAAIFWGFWVFISCLSILCGKIQNTSLVPTFVILFNIFYSPVVWVWFLKFKNIKLIMVAIMSISVILSIVLTFVYNFFYKNNKSNILEQ